MTKNEVRQIKLHVNNIKVGCQISRIKCVTEKRKDQDEEFVKFDGRVTSSKYSFIGYDINPIVSGAVKNAKMAFLRRPIFDKMS